MKEHYDLPQSAEIVAELDAVARHHGSREQAFDDLLTLAVCALAGGMREEEYLKTVKPYVDGDPGKRPIDSLVAAFSRIIMLMEETRADVLGDIFQGAITRGQNQQYFTPDAICDLMARLTDDAASADESPEGNASQTPGSAEQATVCDPCCGSGRLLLAAAKVNRHRFFVGQDIDHRCAKITAINLALWNMYGKVIWGNTLTNEIRRVYHTGFNGRCVIRVEESVASPLHDPEPESPSMPTPLRQGSLFDDLLS